MSREGLGGGLNHRRSTVRGGRSDANCEGRLFSNMVKDWPKHVGGGSRCQCVVTYSSFKLSNNYRKES